RLAAKEQLLAALKAGKPPQILDTRSTAEHCGTEARAKRGGAIPGAKHLEWSDTLDRDGRFKSASAIQKLLNQAGVDPAKPVTTYCQSGGRAALMAFVLELMGGKEVRNYYRSWSEWGKAREPPIANPRRRAKE